jgi:hypothetical protein
MGIPRTGTNLSRVGGVNPALRHVKNLAVAEAERVVRGRLFAGSVLSLTIRPSEIGEDAGAIGAASLVLDGAYSPRLATLLGT